MTDLSSVQLPGRLGAENMDLGTDPRSDPRMVAAMAPLGLDKIPPAAPLGPDADMEAVLALYAIAEEGFGALGPALLAGTPSVEGVAHRTEVIKGVDENDITLHIHEPAERDGSPLPALYHTHGGGMAMLSAADVNYVHWRDRLAASGMVVVGVEFRNAAGVLGPHPFPAGLNDCASGAQWVIANRETLGYSTLTISGESGGGNLAIATTLKAKADGWLDDIDGLYAQCPYISGAYGEPPVELTSLRENDGYFLRVDDLAHLARVYDPTRENARNPLAWPYWATADDLAGLPPTVISVNQLDPLRDEGLLFYRKLLEAGVSTVSRTVNGSCHAGDCLFTTAMPDVQNATLRDIKSFADSL